MYLYTNYNGHQVSSHSYSGGSQFADCPRRYEYHRKKGYREKNVSAAMEFGNAWESALQTFHKNWSVPEALAEWHQGWTRTGETELSYKDRDSWSEMYEQGAELLRLYAVKLPRLPITKNVRFQLNFRKEVFPDSEYEGIDDSGFVDMLVEDVDPEHIMLPPASASGPRQLIVDIKTSGKLYPQDARLLRLDRQLRRYSWQSGIETVAFLVAVRCPRNLERGDNVTLLTSTIGAYAGDDLVFWDADDFGLMLVSEEAYEIYLARQKGIRGNALKAVKCAFAEEFAFVVKASDTTQQRIQFLATVISDRERRDEGELVGKEILDICDCESKGFYPQKPGVRFPAQHCIYCPCLGLCIDDSTMVKHKLVNITGLGPTPDVWDRMLSEAE